MDKIFKTIVVFYREMPNMIHDHVISDGHMAIVKDGVKKVSPEKSAPRISIKIQSINLVADQKRIKELTRMLENLLNNNQIVAFRIA